MPEFPCLLLKDLPLCHPLSTKVLFVLLSVFFLASVMRGSGEVSEHKGLLKSFSLISWGSGGLNQKGLFVLFICLFFKLVGVQKRPDYKSLLYFLSVFSYRGLRKELDYKGRTTSVYCIHISFNVKCYFHCLNS